jgi:NAD(P)H dehydrogenase (quinone)
MNVLLVLAHPERRSFHGAMFDTAVATRQTTGPRVVTGDHCRMGFDPVSSRCNFTTVKDSDYLKRQIEEMNATEAAGFASEIES